MELRHNRTIVRGLCTFFGLTALACAQPRPLDDIVSRQYQHEIRPLRLALDRWLHTLGLQEVGLDKDETGTKPSISPQEPFNASVPHSPVM